MGEKHSRIYASIDLDAVEKNFANMYQNLTPGTQMIAVVKADAYGHGAVKIARLMEPKAYIWGFAVATVEEAVELRDHQIQKPILILGYVFPEDYDTLVKLDIRPAVFTLSMARELSAAAHRAGKEFSIHIALDTGMTRIGFRHPKESAASIAEICQLPNLKLEGIFTHFARADEENLSITAGQLALYEETVQLLAEMGIQIPLMHVNNSAGILWNRNGDLQAVRPGITIYGIAPSDEVVNPGVTLHPVMSLISHVSHVKKVEAGIPVSYGGTFVTSRSMTRIATIPVGYADGYPRSLSNQGEVLIHGKRAKIIGRVCMDQFMVDVTDISDVQVGDRVTLLGVDGKDRIAVEELSKISGRFPYEFVCCISKRVPRIYKKE